MASEKLLLDRRCRLTIANPSTTPGDFAGQSTVNVIEIDGGRTESTGGVGLRIAFKIKKSLEKQPNTAEITVTNLSKDSRSGLQKKGVKLRFEAGYKDTGLSQFFAGDVRSIDHVREKANWDTILKCGDGERAWQYARVNESFKPGTRGADVLKTLGQRMGIELGNLDDKARTVDKVLDAGWSAVGNAATALTNFVDSLGLTVSIQDGKLQILAEDDSLAQSVPDITPQSGLIGSPEMGTPVTKGKPQLLKFKSLLLPVKCGSKVRLKSERYDGFVRVEKVEHTGDTHGGDWYTEMEGVVLR